MTEQAIALTSDLAQRYKLATLKPLLNSIEELQRNDVLSVAVVGRFKAGKSSFLNHFLDRDLLPVGVIPVTTVVTEIGHGSREHVTVHFLDGRVQEVAIGDIPSFVAESENPENAKRVSTLKIELPQLARMRALRFIDMPGLESALAHNTEATLRWLPNIGLALIAISVDPPLSQQDIDLLRRVYEYTPQVSILLTKVDLMSEPERAEVAEYVRERLKQIFGAAPRIFPYSVRPGFENYRITVEQQVLQETLADFQSHRKAILRRKLKTLVRECGDYLRLALISAEAIESERGALERLLSEERANLEQEKSELRLIVRDAAAGTRSTISKRFESYQTKLAEQLSANLEKEFPQWAHNFASVLKSFEQWLSTSLAEELLNIGAEERHHLLAPLEKLKQQVFRRSQTFRDRLSDRTQRAFGIPLRTTEAKIEVAEPAAPDIRVGHVFDRNWELLSPVAPMSLIKPLVARHFRTRLPYMVEKNLSRLATQWDETIRGAMTKATNEAERRLEELVDTVERLLATSHDEAPKIRADLESIDSVARALQEAPSPDGRGLG